MAQTTTTYLGLELKNPFIVGACNLTLDLEMAKKMEDAGAGAIVFKSLFEEQIQMESLQMEEELREYEERNAEMVSLFPNLKHAGPEAHLDQLEKLKKSLSIPVIGSLNCVNADTWVEYAGKMEETGIDALELNFYSVPEGFDSTSEQLETAQLNIVKDVLKKVRIPVSVKLSPFYANPLPLIRQMDELGVSGFVLFNRLFQPDIDLDKQDHRFPFNLSQPEDYRLPLRYAGLLFNEVKGDVCSNTGIFTGQDMARMVLAGASAVQVVSAIYKNKVGHIATMVKDFESWMDANGYNTLKDFKGKLSKAKVKDPYAYQRAQYVDLLMKPFDVMKRYPQV